MSTIDTSTWSPDSSLNTDIGGIPLNADASIQQTWQAIQMLMAALKGDTAEIKLTINQPDGTTIVATNQTLTVVNNAHSHTIANVTGLQAALDGKASDDGMTGATSSADGASGLVPAPRAGDEDKVLKGDGTWGTAGEASSVAWANVTGKPSSFTPSSHSHVGTEVSLTGYSMPASSSAVSSSDTVNDAIGKLEKTLGDKAEDSSVVHKTKNESIGGEKTFTDNIFINQKCTVDGDSSNPARYVVRSTDLSSSVTPETQKSFGFYIITDKFDSNVYTSELDFDTEKVSFKQNIYSGGAFRNSITFDYEFANGHRSFYPYYTGLVSLGNSTHLWKDVWISTGAIQTSDERLKKSINPIPDDVLDAWGEVGFFQFQFNDAFAEKGASARLHSGLVAQRIDEAFRSHGLNASSYGLFCHDEWDAMPEVRNADGDLLEEARPAGDAYSLRYEEALCMEAAYQRRRADRLEARIAALEEALNG